MKDALAVPSPPMIRLLACLFLSSSPASPSPTTSRRRRRPRSRRRPLAEARQRWLRGNYEEARAQYEKLLADEKTRAAAAIGVARTWLSEGEHAKALAAIDEAIRKDEKNPDLLAARADIFYQTGEWDEASKDAEAAIKLKPDHFLARWVRAQLLRDAAT